MKTLTFTMDVDVADDHAFTKAELDSIMGAMASQAYDGDEALPLRSDTFPTVSLLDEQTEVNHDDEVGDSDALIAASIEIFERDGGWWLLITGDLFGPFKSEDETIDKIPAALRSTF